MAFMLLVFKMLIFSIVLAVLGGNICLQVTSAHELDPSRVAESAKYLNILHDESCDNEGAEWLDINQDDEACDGDGQEVSYDILIKLLQSGDIQLIDVRQPEEFAEGSIPSAINVPLDEVTDALTMPPGEFEQSYGARQPQREDSNIVFQCLAGVRSLLALNAAVDQGFHKVMHYPGGWEEWEQLSNES